MIKIAVSKTIDNVLLFILVILAIFLSSYLLLLEGFSIKSLELGKYNVTQFYIKLDKKLNISIKTLDINDTSEESKLSPDDIEDFFSSLNYFYNFVNQLSIEKITYKDNSFKFLYKYKEFFISDNKYQLFASISKEGKVTKLKINKLSIADFDVTLKGELIAYNNFSFASFDGYINVAKTKWKTNLFYKDHILKYDLSSEKTDSIEPLMQLIEKNVELEELVSAWIYKKIKAKSYEIKYLKGEINTKTFEFDPNLIYAKGVGKDVDVYFHPDVKPAHIDQVDLELINDSLKFKLTNPKYLDFDCNESYVQIDKLLTVGTKIVVDIVANNVFLDDRIRNILRAYDIDFGLEQKSGTLDGNITLDVKFVPYDLKSYGTYKTKNGSFRYLDSIDFIANDLEISHENYLVNVRKSNIIFKDLLNVDVKDGVLNLREKNFKSKLFANDITLKEKSNEIAHIEDEMLDLELSYKNNLAIFIPQIPLNIDYKDGNFVFTISNLAMSKPYFPLQEKYKIDEGDITVETNDFENYFAILNATKISTPLIKYSKPINALHLDIAVDKNSIVGVDRFEGLEFVHTNDLEMKLNNFDINISKTSQMMESLNSKTKITAFNSKALLSDTSTVIFDKAEVLLHNNKTDIDLVYEDGSLNFKSDGQVSSFKIKGMNQEFVKNFLNFNELEGGIYNANGHINKDGLTTVDLNFEDAYAKDSTVFNNLLSFINTIPSLATLKDNYFDKKGYLIKKGHIKANIKDSIATFEEIKLKGTNADFDGSGYANLNTKTLNLLMKISTFKNIGSIVSNIPLAGYLILGDDGTIGASFNVGGTFDNPKITTNVAKDSILAPFNIFKRVITLPTKLFESNEKE